jgi:hypothetical protein
VHRITGIPEIPGVPVSRSVSPVFIAFMAAEFYSELNGAIFQMKKAFVRCFVCSRL